MYQACCTTAQRYSQVRVLHPDSGEDVVLFQGTGHAYEPVISADGRRVAFLSTIRFGTTDAPGLSQIYIASIDGTELQAVTSDSDGIAGFTLSGDGKTIWYLTGSGALYMLDLASGKANQRVPPTCATSLTGDISPGSAVYFSGTCLGAGYTTTFDGIPGPLIARTASGVWIQVPWEVQAPKTTAVLVDSVTPSPFGPALNAAVTARVTAPRFAVGPIHQDWSGLVTSSSPARPNEIIQFYATGLGPVQPRVATGAPTPGDPLSRVVEAFNCNLPVPFAGLAPGLIGFYQVQIQMPNSGAQNWQLSCTGANVTVPIQF